MQGMKAGRVVAWAGAVCVALAGCQDGGEGSGAVDIEPIEVGSEAGNASNPPVDDPPVTTGSVGSDPDLGSGDDPAGGDAFDAQRFRESIGGRWKGPCLPEGSIWVRSLIEFGEEDSLIGAIGYLASGCSSPAFEITTTMRVGIGSELVLADSERVAEIDFVYGDSVRMTITDLLFLLASNANNYCGQNDWVLSVSYDITGCTEAAAARPFLGSTQYQIVKLDLPTMYLGDEDNVDSERSLVLDLQTPYVRSP